MDTEQNVATWTDEDYKNWRYQPDFPTDRENLAEAFRLLESYSSIPPSEIESHVRAVRDKAWSIFPYACIGRWRFLHLYLTSIPEYPSLLSRVKSGAIFLDVGCCLGQILRQLVFDGAPAENLVGIDLHPEFLELGYQLFRDRDRFPAALVSGDLLNPSDANVAALDGSVDIVHVASVFHLFGWDDQVKLGERIVRFFKPGAGGAVVVGRQVGSREPRDQAEHAKLGLGRYHHSPETMRILWDEIGERTGTRWEVDATMIDLIPDSEVPRVGIQFVIYRIPGLEGTQTDMDAT